MQLLRGDEPRGRRCERLPNRRIGLLNTSESPISSEPAASMWLSMTPMVWIVELRGSRLCRELLVFGRLRARRGILKGFKA